MAELYAANDLRTPLPGYEREHSVYRLRGIDLSSESIILGSIHDVYIPRSRYFDVDELRLPLVWKGAGPVSSAVKEVVVRLFFRDATVYALGSGEL